MNKVNKMIIDKEVFVINDYVGEIEIRVNKLVLNILGNVVLNERLLNTELDLTINIMDNSTLLYNRFGKVLNNDTKIIINQNNNTKLKFNEAFICNKDSSLKITNNIIGNKNKSDIVVRVTSANNSNVLIEVTGEVKKDTIDNELKEDLRGLEQDNSKITIIPNMLVYSSEIIANHNVTLGNVSNDDLFYLMSKGLNKNAAVNLLKIGFLISIFEDNNIKKYIKEIL